MLNDDSESLNSAIKIIEDFGDCSGLRANFEKTEAVWIGARRGCIEELQTKKCLKWNHNGSFKLLGLKYNLQADSIYIENYTEKVTSFKNVLKNWSYRNLSLMGKVTVVKTIALPILIQTFMALPDPPKRITDEIQSHIFISSGMAK